MVSFNGIKFPNAKSIVVKDNKVFIDGEELKTEEKVINISVSGSIDKIEADNCNSIDVKGDCTLVKTTNGDVTVGGNVIKSVTTVNGDVKAKEIHGDVETVNGNIKYKVK